LEEHPDEAKGIINKVILAQKARKAAKAAKDSVLRKGALEGMTLPGKLADCQSRSAEDSELFIVEGDSAGGTAKTGRDRKTQAILPLRGKILNVERARLDRMLASEQIKNLVIAMGTAIGDVFDESKLRYHKLIIATDADIDGAHIRTLILTLFYRYFKTLIEGGYVYIAMPPLYKIKKGKESTYVYTEEEKTKLLGKDADKLEVVPSDGEESTDVEATTEKKTPKISIQRYKGLGEMNADELWETTMDPEARLLKQVKIEDAAEADRVFDMLMGTDVSSRKSFIQSNAKRANIDV
jgi:DNA gyrase subunit B